MRVFIALTALPYVYLITHLGDFFRFKSLEGFPKLSAFLLILFLLWALALELVAWEDVKTSYDVHVRDYETDFLIGMTATKARFNMKWLNYMENRDPNLYHDLMDRYNRGY